MNITISGLPALLIVLAFVGTFTLPVWGAAHFVGAGYATFPRSAATLLVGALLSILSYAVLGGWVALLSPLSFLLATRFILDTSFRGAFVLTLLAATGMAFVAKLLTMGFSASPA